MRARVLISGLVQGVNFRAWLKYRAEELGINGWVRNVYGEDIKLNEKIVADFQGVEAVFVGETQAVEALVKLCWQGPTLSQVKEVVVAPLADDALKTPQEFSGFQIVR